MSRIALHLLITSALMAQASSAVFAGWTCTIMHPTGMWDSRACGVDGNQMAGYGLTSMQSTYRALAWNGSGSAVDLTPSWAARAQAVDCSNGYQVGNVTGDGDVFSGRTHASLWHGTADSWTDLNPAGAGLSYALGISGSHQVGYAILQQGQREHAMLWSGSANTYVDLHPAGAVMSKAYSVYGDKQVGEFHTGSFEAGRAALWSGSAGSCVSLNPTPDSTSFASGIWGDQQVGWVKNSATRGYQHAALWRGTADSWVDLAPNSPCSSAVLGVAHGVQVGYVDFVPAIWFGTAASGLQLPTRMPGGWMKAVAQDVDVVGSDIWVTGAVQSYATGTYQAIVWHYSPAITTDVMLPEPSSLLALGSGLLGLLGVIRRRK